MTKSLRPKNLEEYIGQEEITEQLKVFIKATKIRSELNEKKSALYHTMLEGGAGLGKTSLAMVIAEELGCQLRIIQGKSIKTNGELAKTIIDLNDGDILFIDEIHTLETHIEEMLLSIIEDFRLDIIIESDGEPKPISIDLSEFTLIGATTEVGRLKQPFRERFKYQFEFKRYSIDELLTIIQLNVDKMHCSITNEAATMIAKASRGTPRIALNSLTVCCDWAIVQNNHHIDSEVVKTKFKYSATTETGLSGRDFKYLKAVRDYSRPIGLKVLSEVTAIDQKTIETVIEPYLHEQGYIEKRSNGRALTEKGLFLLNEHIDL